MADELNSVGGQRMWTPDDIARAHRVGQSREGEPKPMIVKFSRWGDNTAVITEYRDNLADRGVATC